jgi:hypothetical protein
MYYHTGINKITFRSKNSILLLILNFVFLSSFSQTYSGQLIDQQSGKAVAYANIGIININVGTVSDINGWFSIALNPTNDKDTLRISCIGYKGKQYLVSSFKKYILNSEQQQIELSPISYTLDEILIKPVKTKTYTLGYYCESGSAYGNAFYSKELGTEMGVVMKLPRKKDKAFLKSIRFYVGEFTFDTFPVRLNIYTLKNGLPYENILREPIFLEINSSGEYIVNLQSQYITVNGNFFVSLEYFKIPDQSEGKLVFCAVHEQKKNNGNSYYRLTSQGKWQIEMFDHVGFSVVVECEK